MRIGFLGNTNNYPFSLARAIRAMGHDVIFLVTGDQVLDRPENRYFDISPGSYPDWIVDLGVMTPLDFAFPTKTFRRMRKLLSGCDAVVVNGLGPALALSCQRPSIVILTGSDLEQYANWANPVGVFRDLLRRHRYLSGSIAALIHSYLTYRQRKGIGEAVAVCYFPRGVVPAGDALLSSLMREDQTRLTLLMTDTDAIKAAPEPSNRKVRVFNIARLNWKRPDPRACSELDYKGTDSMLRGVKRFVERHGNQVELVLVRKGLHVAETLELVNQLGLAGVVTWLDELTQREVLEQYRLANLVTDQITTSIVGMGGLDAMATGRPLIANGRPEIAGNPLGHGSPICQAANEEEVAAQLERLVLNPDDRVAIGKLSREYAEKNLSAQSAARIVVGLLSGEFPAPGRTAGIS